MSSKACAKCEKTVYPLEELKCLDKTWHKGCFKCHECGMTLNMKTYKGFNKLPYCEAHIPKAKATTVAETPELKRIQENTKIQSNAAYHAEFEKSKGKFTPVVDDPESLRIRQNTKIISNVAYHGDLEKKAMMEQKRTLGEGERNRNGVSKPKSPSYMDELSSLPTPQTAPTSHHHQQANYGQPPMSNASSYGSSRSANNYHHDDGYNHSHQRQHQQQQQQQQQHHYQQQQQQQQHHHHQQVASQQYHGQHMNHGSGGPSPYSSRGQPNVIYSSDGAVNSNSRKPGSIADYDPMNNYYGSQHEQHRATQQAVTGRIPSSSSHGYNRGQQGGQAQARSQPHHQQPSMHGHGHYPPSSGICYRALYDYEAQDVDEVSFSDGDLIIDCTSVDEGWLTGTIQRSGKRGMLPANYVSPAN